MYWTYSCIRECDPAYVPLGGSRADRNTGLRGRWNRECGLYTVCLTLYLEVALKWKVVCTNSKGRLNIEERTCSQLEIEFQCFN